MTSPICIERLVSSQESERPGAAPSARSIPDISLVEFDLVPEEELSKFVLKRDLAVMVFLRLDVSNDIRDARLADREGGVTGLPAELGDSGSFGLHPFRTPLLDLFDDLLQGMIPGQREQRMHMVLGPANDQSRAVPFTEEPCLVAKERCLMGLRNPGLAVFGAIDEMNQILCQ
jgi:hypothetical protein